MALALQPSQTTLSTRPPSARQQNQRVRVLQLETQIVPGEGVAAVRGDEDYVLDAKAPILGVGAGLERDHHAGLELQIVAGHDPWLLVRRQPDAVAGVVREGEV